MTRLMTAELNPRTRERILDGARLAIARHGLAKLGMSDVSVSAGVSRGTLYRYFPTRGQLLQSLAELEIRRFEERIGAVLRGTPPGPQRFELVVQQVARTAREHPVIQRVIETEPAYVLAYLRAEFPALRAITGALLAPLLADLVPARQGAVATEQLVDWLTRVLISAVLFPDPDPDRLAAGLAAVYGLLLPATPAAPRAAARRGARTRKDRR